MADIQQELYEKREKIYPREVHGLFAFLRLVGVVGLLGLYFLLPWFSWGGRQSLLFDLPERKFYVFSLIFWPQDFVVLTILMIILGISLFLFTVLAGRLWCGYSCPQTVWTEVFLWIERRIEGSRAQQIKLDQSAWSIRKFRLKFSKHLAWFAISFWTAVTFVGYFTPIRELLPNLVGLAIHPWTAFWILFFTVATYMNAGWLREQVCLHMCPYARFQSAMFDKNTLIISYDSKRGEPRGSRSRKINPRELGMGDCIDCTMCVQVCPTGIDIRKGLQYECIGCAACIDACNDVMKKMNYSTGLIRYTTENELSGQATKFLRPQVFIYAAILSVLVIAVTYGILARTPLDVDVIRDRNILYRQVDETHVDNVYTLRILNKSSSEHTYGIDIEGIEHSVLLMNNPNVFVPAGGVVDVPVTVRSIAKYMAGGSIEFAFRVWVLDTPNIEILEKARLVTPN